MLSTLTRCTRAARPTRPWTRMYASNNPSHMTAQGARDRSTVGVFTPIAAVTFAATGVALYFYFQHEKAEAIRLKCARVETPPPFLVVSDASSSTVKAIEEANANVGRANIGGPFKLTKATGGEFTEKELVGKWNLLYFGFTNCPDICPAEMDKMGVVIDELEAKFGELFQPVFISVDPARDPPATVKRYLADFHPRFTGLTASKLVEAPPVASSSKSSWWNPFSSASPLPPQTLAFVSDTKSPTASEFARTPAQEAHALTKAICKVYRVYFSTPPNAKPHDDYLVDHSIFVYFMDPNGEFVDAYGQSVPAQEIVERVGKEVEGWRQRNT